MKSSQFYNDIEVAELSDFEEIVDLIIYFATDESHDFEESNSNIARGVAKWMSKYPAFIYKANGDIVGLLLLDDFSHWWQDKSGFYNTIMYITPEFRTPELFQAFLETAENYAIIKNTEFAFSLVGTSRIDVKEKLLKRYGYNKIGVFLQKDK